MYSTEIFNRILWHSIVSTRPKHLHFYVSKIFFHIRDTSISTYLLTLKSSFASKTHPFLRICSTKIFFRILDISISSYLIDRNILSHPVTPPVLVSTRPKYSIASSTPQFLRIYSTRIFYRILDTSISSYLLDQNILSHPTSQFLCIDQKSIASSTPQFLHIYSTRIFYRILLDISISSYLLDQNIPSHPRQLHFFVSTRPEYSFASSTPPFSLYLLEPRTFYRILWQLNFFISTWPRIFYRILDTFFLCIYSTRIFYRILDKSISSYLLDQKYSIASSTTQFLRIYSTEVFYRILDTSISSYLLDQNILSHPRHLHFFVPTRPEYSIASSTPQFLRIYSTTIFFCIPDISISTYLLDQNIPSHPQQLHFYISSRPEYSIASLTPPFLCINSTKIFVRIRDTSISTYQVYQNILFASWMQLEVCFFVSTKMMMNKQNRANEQLKHLDYHASFYC